MEMLLLGTLLLAFLSEAASVPDLKGKALIFPQESSTAYVSLIPSEKKSLQNFTLSRSRDNELLLFVEKPGEYSLTIANSPVFFVGPSPAFVPIHVCVSWESASGIAELWVNGKPLGRKGVRKGYSLDAEAKIFLGQEQDSFGGSFDSKQSFVGEIWDVTLWDQLLPLKDMCAYCRSGNLLDWHHLIHREYGYVVTKPKVWV
ncbi:Mucosal pentraxin [Galemys pyrenaicus]|uniref:Pentraxin family member n=1 Tax=Galemys pyrenaicus TaxID=202257 RepID=A0A8J6DIU7_GALPY|nr:Mucosal pentraxin [Galemys pyrenaicus]